MAFCREYLHLESCGHKNVVPGKADIEDLPISTKNFNGMCSYIKTRQRVNRPEDG